MKLLAILFTALLVTSNAQATSIALPDCPSTLKFIKRKLNSSETVNLCNSFKGDVLLIVNTASYCGFSKQFTGLEELYQKYKDNGFAVLGFPSHDFNQEDDDEAKSAEICELTYGVKFPMFEPMAVRGDDADPLFRILAKQADVTPKWNFYKYLVGRDGKVIKGYNSMVSPDSDKLIKAIETALKQPKPAN